MASLVYDIQSLHNDWPFVTRLATHGNSIDVEEVIATLSHVDVLNYMHLAKQLVSASLLVSTEKTIC